MDQTAALLKRLLELEALLRPDNYKELYAERDAITLTLQQSGFVSCEHEGKELTLKDNFEGKNCAWTAAPVRRFEIVIKEKAKE